MKFILTVDGDLMVDEMYALCPYMRELNGMQRRCGIPCALFELQQLHDGHLLVVQYCATNARWIRLEECKYQEVKP